MAISEEERKAKGRAYQREYQARPEYKAKARERDRKRMATTEDKAKRRGYMREYRARPVNEAKRREYRARPESKVRARARGRAYYAKPENEAKERERKAMPEYKAKAREWGARRRARKLGASGSHTEAQWQARAEFYGWRCRYCSCQLDDSTAARDHVIPLSKGGPDWASNLVPACTSCNSSKGAKTLDEWVRP